MKEKNLALNFILFILLLVTAFVFIVPFLWTFLTSLKTNDEIYASALTILPTKITFEHYVKVITQMGDFLKYFRNSVVVSLWSVLATVVFSASMGYAFSKMDFKFKNIYLGFVLFILTLPYVIYLIPIYIMESKMDLIDTAWGLILPYIATHVRVYHARPVQQCSEYSGRGGYDRRLQQLAGFLQDHAPGRKARHRHRDHFHLYQCMG